MDRTQTDYDRPAIAYSIMMKALRPLAVGLTAAIPGNCDSYSFRNDAERYAFIDTLRDGVARAIPEVRKCWEGSPHDEADKEIRDVEHALRIVHGALWAARDGDIPNVPGDLLDMVIAAESLIGGLYTRLLDDRDGYEEMDAEYLEKNHPKGVPAPAIREVAHA